MAEQKRLAERQKEITSAETIRNESKSKARTMRTSGRAGGGLLTGGDTGLMSGTDSLGAGKSKLGQ